MINKKGAELSFNMIIIAVLGILVLVVVAAFFISNFTNFGSSIDDLNIDKVSVAQSTCNSACDLDKSIKSQSYCTTTFNLDRNKDGRVDTDSENNAIEYHCWQDPINVNCPDIQCER